MRRFTVGAAVLAMAAMSLVPSSATAIPVPVVAPLVRQVIEIGPIRECPEPVPAALAVTPVEKDLRVKVLYQGVDSAEAAEIVGAAHAVYASVGLTIDTEYDGDVGFTSTDPLELIEASKDRVGRDHGFDMVYLLTTTNLELGGDDSVAGMADCIGGIANDDTAFAVGEAFLDKPGWGTKIFAHELGHLLGAHHHYANCIEADLLSLLGEDACTLMFNFVNNQALQFSTLNAAVVGGYAEEYAGG